eukprot:jgi/Phyca11/8674/fgenesh1_pm.PHYCAscaffold_30_\
MSASVGYRRRDANASDAVAAILHPDEGYREKQKRNGVVPKDFERENKLRVKKLQAENRERRRHEHHEFKLTKFKGVRPRVNKENEPTNGEQVKKHEFLRRGGRPSSFQSPSQSTINGSKRRIHRKAPVPSVSELERREEELNKMTRKDPVDFVNANAWKVIKKTPTTPIEERAPRPVNRNFGRIPQYLLKRKEQWAREEEERRQNAPDPDCPPGMILLDEDERVRTLDVLQKSLIEAQLRMNSLPLRIETLNQIRRKNELETKLQEIEDAIKVFDRAKVYVAAPLTNDPEKNRGRTGSIAA